MSPRHKVEAMTDQAPAVDPGAPDIPGKPTSASRTTLSHIMTHNDTNLLGTVHGGVIMKLVDDAAGAVAGRHSGGPPGTPPLGEKAFLEPGRGGGPVPVKGHGKWARPPPMEGGVRGLPPGWKETTPPPPGRPAPP